MCKPTSNCTRLYAHSEYLRLFVRISPPVCCESLLVAGAAGAELESRALDLLLSLGCSLPRVLAAAGELEACSSVSSWSPFFGSWPTRELRDSGGTCHSGSRLKRKNSIGSAVIVMSTPFTANIRAANQTHKTYTDVQVGKLVLIFHTLYMYGYVYSYREAKVRINCKSVQAWNCKSVTKWWMWCWTTLEEVQGDLKCRWAQRTVLFEEVARESHERRSGDHRRAAGHHTERERETEALWAHQRLDESRVSTVVQPVPQAVRGV